MTLVRRLGLDESQGASKLPRNSSETVAKAAPRRARRIRRDEAGRDSRDDDSQFEVGTTCHRRCRRAAAPSVPGALPPPPPPPHCSRAVSQAFWRSVQGIWRLSLAFWQCPVYSGAVSYAF